jgi:hypothetical protein
VEEEEEEEEEEETEEENDDDDALASNSSLLESQCSTLQMRLKLLPVPVGLSKMPTPPASSVS